ncbi:hypothetical protein EDD21DRAFT_373972 [Dissophora ornata]|nr:hypothetical protein BGZ58_007246 [Dissophora ornata]KAI8601622.1 hypothetical protein EDD21DRAFT_373972 [Dissophora ornata]
MISIISQFSGLIPQPHTDHGLRQLQLTTLGFVVIYALLHLALFMDGMVFHVFFAIEVGTIILYTFLPVQYSTRPVSLLKRRFYMLVGLASMWLIQPWQLPLLDPATSEISLLFDKREDLTLKVAKTLNQIQIEKILQQGGKVEEGFKEQNAYAAQMAVSMQALAWMTVLVASMIVIEAIFVWNRCMKIEAAGPSSAEREKQSAQAASASKAAAKASK